MRINMFMKKREEEREKADLRKENLSKRSLKANILSMEEILKKMKNAKKIIIIEDIREIRESLYYFLKKENDAKIIKCKNVSEVNELIKKGGIDEESVVYIDNNLPYKNDYEEGAGERIYKTIKKLGGFAFICSSDSIEKFSDGISYINKSAMVSWIYKKRGNDAIIPDKKEFERELKEAKRVVVVEDDEISLRFIKNAIERKMGGETKDIIIIKTGEELERLIEDKKIDKNSIILLDNRLPYKQGKGEEPIGKQFYWELLNISKSVYITSSEEPKNFRGMNYIGKQGIAEYLF